MTINWGQQYQQTLGRTAAPEEINWWSSHAQQQGWDANTAAQAFTSAAQTELQSRPASPAPAVTGGGYDPKTLTGVMAGNMDGTLERSEINNAYQNLFGRDADQAGLDWWSQQKGITEENLYANLLGGAQDSRDRGAAQYAQTTLSPEGRFNTPVSQTWADPSTKNPALNDASKNSLLGWNAELNRWELGKPQQPGAGIGAPGSTSQYNPDFDRQVTDQELVEMRVANLVKNSHPLLEQARQRTLEQFSARGLLNSSVAMQAAQEAVLAKAIEMASQDAATMNKQGMANQGYKNEFAGREQTQNYTRENQYNDYLYRGDLMQQEYGLRGGLLERELAVRDRYEQSAASRNESTDARGRYTTSMSQLQRDYQNEYARLTQNADIAPAEQERFIDNLNKRYRVMYDDINAIYEALPVWQNAWSVAWGSVA